MTTDAPFAGLVPAPLWKLFAELVAIPRPSGHEERAAAWVRAWAEARGFESLSDSTGNVVVRVPASPGCEGAPCVVLQSHLDIVCEKEPGTPYDPESGRIHAVLREDGWLAAEGTTLGADNGIGVVAAMAAAEPGATTHGPLELLFTIDEERGLTGASGLDPELLRGRVLVNLDSEEHGALFVGCAGGTDTVVRWRAPRAAVGSGESALRVVVEGLSGGHSGIDIHRLRANAIKVLASVLDGVGAVTPFSIDAFSGGSKRNAIPRDAEARIFVPAGSAQAVAKAAREVETRLRARHAGADDGLSVRVLEEAGGGDAFDRTASGRLVDLVRAFPCGVLAMSSDIPGLVETSTSLGVARTEGDTIRLVSATRSSSAHAMTESLASLHAAARLAGAEPSDEGSYPGWQPDLASRALAATREAYRDLFGDDPEVTAVHAGLECGLIGEKVAGMDMISFGPDIAGPHAPGERVRVESVARFFDLLGATLARLAR